MPRARGASACVRVVWKAQQVCVKLGACRCAALGWNFSTCLCTSGPVCVSPRSPITPLSACGASVEGTGAVFGPDGAACQSNVALVCKGKH